MALSGLGWIGGKASRLVATASRRGPFETPFEAQGKQGRRELQMGGKGKREKEF